MLLQKMCKLFNEKIIWNMNEFGGSQKKNDFIPKTFR